MTLFGMGQNAAGVGVHGLDELVLGDHVPFAEAIFQPVMTDAVGESGKVVKRFRDAAKQDRPVVCVKSLEVIV